MTVSLAQNVEEARRSGPGAVAPRRCVWPPVFWSA